MSLSNAGKFVLGAGFFAQFFAAQGVHILAVPYYQMTLGVDPLLLGLAMALPLLLAGCLGPIAGHASDNFTSRWGRRRPFIALSALVLCVSYGLIWMVPQNWAPLSQFTYFALMVTIFYIAGITYGISLRSFTYEQSGNYHQRTAILGVTTYFEKAGSLVYQWAFPLAQLAIFGGLIIGIQFVGWMIGIGIFAVLGMLPALLIQEVSASVKPENRMVLRQSLSFVIKDRRMQTLATIILIQCGGAASVAMLDYYVLVYYVNEGDIQQGSVWKGFLSTTYAVCGIAYVPIVTRLSYYCGKLQALRLIFLLTAAGGLAKWFIFTPGSGWFLIFDALIGSAIWTAMAVLVPSMIADCCSPSLRRASPACGTGIYASVQSLALTVATVTGFLGYGIYLNLIGFDASLGDAQPNEAIFAMRILLSGGTIACSLLALFALRRYSSTGKNRVR